MLNILKKIKVGRDKVTELLFGFREENNVGNKIRDGCVRCSCTSTVNSILAMSPHLHLSTNEEESCDESSPRASGTESRKKPFWFDEIAKIYKVPQPASSLRKHVVVISFGGGLFGDVNPKTGELTNGDCHKIWAARGIKNMATVRIVPISGARNQPRANDPATIENSVDIQMIGAIAPHTDITLIIGTSFLDVLKAAGDMNPDVISISWGFREVTAPPSWISSINTLLQGLNARGINICCSAGDAGATDNGVGLSVDFPGASPFVTCCGGTSLICPSGVYDDNTVETVWNDNPTAAATGGGVSTVFRKPDYQQKLIPDSVSTMRCCPDISGVADGETGVNFQVGREVFPVGGTSIVSPFMAALMCIFDIRTFINPSSTRLHANGASTTLSRETTAEIFKLA